MNDYENSERAHSQDQSGSEEEGLSIADQVEILFQYGESKRMVTTYHGIAAGIGVAAINVQKIRQGTTKNPGVSILRGIAKYFGVGLGYFDCTSEEECWDYLRNAERSRVLNELVQEVPLRADELTPDTFRAMMFAMEQVRKAEARTGSGK